jgi:hypothetical protein
MDFVQLSFSLVSVDLSPLFSIAALYGGAVMYSSNQTEDLIMLNNLIGIERSELNLAAPTGLLDKSVRVSAVDVVWASENNVGKCKVSLQVS